MEYVIVYVKIMDDKKEGITFNGPWLGATEETREAAETIVKKMINETRGCALISKIFEVKDGQYDKVKDTAAKYFERIKQGMNESKKIMERPVTKRRKKRRSVRTKKLE